MGKSRPEHDLGKGTPGFYRLNQKVQKFQDRRTRRGRDRSSQNRNAIQDYHEDDQD